MLGSEEDNHPKTGSARAWLAHLDLVKFAVASDFSTVLILEDDVDWDVSLKKQMRMISNNIRKFTNVDGTDRSPYGSSWDILWIGHCGEHTDPDTHRIEFADPACPPTINYTGWAQKYVVHLEEGRRAIQKGINTVCTFGYALTRAGAQKVLRWAGTGENEAYDIRLMQGCKSKELDCVVVTPELMHHYTPSKELGYMSSAAASDGKGSSVDEAVYEHVMGATENIMQSTRCKVLFDDTCVKKERDY